MSYHFDFTDLAKEDINSLKKSGNKALLKKIYILLTEIREHPFTGLGKPEALKHHLTGLWSRRINKEHRLIYEISDDRILILSAKGHYQ